MATASRFKRHGMALLVVVAVSAPLNATAQPRHAAVAQVRQGATVVRLLVDNAAPYGYAAVNGRRLSIQCVKVQGQVFLTTLLIPTTTQGVVVVKGRLSSGKTLWITILKHIIGPPRLSVRTSPGENWGWCGTGGVSFTGARPSTGYVLITP